VVLVAEMVLETMARVLALEAMAWVLALALAMALESRALGMKEWGSQALAAMARVSALEVMAKAQTGTMCQI
jgi:hypothetical protein